MPMQIYSDMLISAAPTVLSEFLDRLDNAPKNSQWQRNIQAEESLAALDGPSNVFRCYVNTETNDLPSIFLWLSIKPHQWAVTNIVPAKENSALTPTQYNLFLVSFRRYLVTVAGTLSVNITEPQLEVGPEFWLTSKSAALLHTFSALANKSTGASHPRDRVRWHAFVKSAHEDSPNLGASDLARILVEHEHWPAEQAQELAILFEYEQALLNDVAQIA